MCLKTNGLETVSSNLLNTALRVSSKSRQNIELQISLRDLVSSKHLKKDVLYKIGSNVIKHFETDETIKGISLSPTESKVVQLNFQINNNFFLKSLLDEVWTCQEDSYIETKLFSLPKEKIVVEYSSPNIAKPFHVGHLRSTLIGNFLSNLFKAMGHDVKRLNYLGDWGTQFGLLQFGIESGWHSMEEISQNPIKLLLDIYIRANKMAEEDESVARKARHLFSKMENGDGNILRDWSTIRQYTINELSQTYARLGVHFDEFHWESTYGIKASNSVLDSLRQQGCLIETAEGKQVAQLGNSTKTITLVKSDGSSLYLTRDLAAAIDRQQRYQFQRMYYVVDNGQSNHFIALKDLLKLMTDSSWTDSLQHIKFGRIQGMSTRKGTAIYLAGVLDEAFTRMKAKQMQSPTTKVDVDANPQITDTLAVTSVIIHDLKQRRQKDYVFNWDDALQDKGDTGTRLQYTYSRLCSLEKMCGVVFSPESVLHSMNSAVIELEMIDLIRDLGRFRQVLQDCHDQLEPCILVRYLFDLSHSISAALKLLPVKNQPIKIATTRLALFSTSKRILGIGLRLLGIKPLTKM